MFYLSDEKIERIAIEKTKRLAKRLMNETEGTTTVTLQDDEKDDEKWDCETILTTYSNTYNHPKLITQIPTNKIRLSKKTGLPLADNNKIATKEAKVVQKEDDDSDDDDDDTNRPQINTERKKGETSEERRARKHAIKEIRRVNFNSPLFLFKLSSKFSFLGSTNYQKSNEDRFQTRRTKTITRTGSKYHSSTYAKSSCYLNCFFFLQCFFLSNIQKKRNVHRFLFVF